jgi:hypothetical protein
MQPLNTKTDLSPWVVLFKQTNNSGLEFFALVQQLGKCAILPTGYISKVLISEPHGYGIAVMGIAGFTFQMELFPDPEKRPDRGSAMILKSCQGGLLQHHAAPCGAGHVGSAWYDNSQY